MKKLLFASAFFSMLAFLCHSCVFGDFDGDSGEAHKESYVENIAKERLAQIKETKSFRVAVCADTPPFAMRSGNGELSGMELDIVKAIAKELGLKAEFIPVSREMASSYIRNGNADLLCGAFDESSLIRQFLTPCIEYLAASQKIVIRSEAAAFVNDLKQLNTDKITIISILGENGASLSSKYFPSAKTLTLLDFEKALETLKANENMALLVDNADLLKRDSLEADPKLKILPGKLGDERFAMGIRRGDTNWKDLLDTGFRKASESGEIARTIGRRFPNISVGSISVEKSGKDSAKPLELEVGK